MFYVWVVLVYFLPNYFICVGLTFAQYLIKLNINMKLLKLTIIISEGVVFQVNLRTDYLSYCAVSLLFYIYFVQVKNQETGVYDAVPEVGKQYKAAGRQINRQIYRWTDRWIYTYVYF